MTIQEIVALGFDEQKKLLAVRPTFDVEQGDAADQYDVDEHKVFSTSERPDKTVQRPTGTLNDDGTEQTTTANEPVTRIGLAYQELIVDRAVGFMLGNPVELKNKYYTLNQNPGLSYPTWSRRFGTTINWTCFYRRWPKGCSVRWK